MDPIDSSSIVSSASTILRNGGAIVYPTDTLYGLGVDPFQPDALAFLYELKGRSKDAKISIGIPDIDSAAQYGMVDKRTGALMKELLPGPVTFVLEKKDERLPWKTVGIRLPDNDISLALYKAYGPITATSANISGKMVPTDLEGIKRLFGERIGHYIPGDIPLMGKASTVVECIGGRIRILREGVVPSSKILTLWGEK